MTKPITTGRLVFVATASSDFELIFTGVGFDLSGDLYLHFDHKEIGEISFKSDQILKISENPIEHVERGIQDRIDR